MGLPLVLYEAGFTPQYADVTAAVTLVPHGTGFKISRSQRRCRQVPLVAIEFGAQALRAVRGMQKITGEGVDNRGRKNGTPVPTGRAAI